MGGGDIGTLSLPLKSRMKPLFFLPIVFGAPLAPASEELLGSVGVPCKSTTDDDVKPFPLVTPLLLAERILDQFIAEAAKPASDARAVCMDAALVTPAVAVALRDRSRACACASSGRC